MDPIKGPASALCPLQMPLRNRLWAAAKFEPNEIFFALIEINMDVAKPKFKRLDFHKVPLSQQVDRGDRFFERMNSRRTVREYSDQDVPIDLIEKAIATAGTAPSGANMQPWRFVVVKDSEVKRKIREAAEKEEYESYHGRMSEKWLRRLAILGTDEHKPFLEVAPYLIVVFRITSVEENGETEPTYYSQESVGIAVGLLLAALHNMGLATLTHTPSPMRFLKEILGRPKNEVPFVLIPVGYPAEGTMVPDIKRKALSEIVTMI
ncbi:MAG: nitroreductase family protein [Pyrinomonadaceae bacterium]